MGKHAFATATIADVCGVAALLGAIGCAAARRPAEPAPAPVVPLVDVLRRHLRGFTNLRDGRVVREADIFSYLDVYVNGLRSAGVDVRSGDLAGVEYYQASDAPVSYRRAFTSAPALLLWLKP